MKIKTILDTSGKKLYQIQYDKKGELFLDGHRVTSDTTSDFDAVLFKGKLHIVYKDRLNCVYLLTEKGKRVLLKSKNIGKIRIQRVKLWVYQSHLLMFYVMFYQKKNMLCCQNLSSLSEPPQVIDLCGNAEYYLQNQSDVFYLFYAAQTEKQFLIRRFTGTWSAPQVIFEGEIPHFCEVNAFSEGLVLRMETEQFV